MSPMRCLRLFAPSLAISTMTGCGAASGGPSPGSTGSVEEPDDTGLDPSGEGVEGSSGAEPSESTGLTTDDGGPAESSADSGSTPTDCEGWEAVAGVPGVDYYDVAWIDDARGWIVGLAGTAITTADGGQTWTSVEIGAADDLRTVAFAPGSSAGWIVGGSAIDAYDSLPTTIRRTEDGGTGWSGQSTGIFFPPTRVHATGPDEAWMIWGLGDLHPDGHWQRTSDGGNSWGPPAGDFIRPGRALMDVFFIDPLEGWIAASNTEVMVVIDGMVVESPIAGPGKRGIFHTTDGGATWSLQPTPIDAPVYFMGVHFADADHGWVVDDAGDILGTVDGGGTWSSQPGGDAALHSVYARSTATAWAVGAGGAIWRTDDGGAGWATEPSGTSNTLRRVGGAPGGGNPWAVGDGGVVLHCVGG